MMPRGSIYRKGDGWAIRYDAGKREDGERDQRYAGGFATEREAQIALATALAEVAAGRHVRQTRATLGSYATEWLDLGDWRPTTRRRYAGAVQQVILSTALARAPLSTLTGAAVQRQFRALAERYGPVSVARMAATVRSVLHSAVRAHLLSAEVLAQVPRPREPHTEQRAWDAATLDHFLTASVADEHAVLWALYAQTGLRRGEALGLVWSDLDLRARRLSVHRQALLIDGRVRLAPPKTRRSERTLSLQPHLADALRIHQAAQRTTYLALGIGRPEPDLVFCRAPGVPCVPETISRRFRDLITGLDLPRIRLHDLRHTHATLLLRAGANPRWVADRLGHDLGMLLRVYAHAFAADDDLVLTRLDEMLAAARRVEELTRDEERGR